MKAITVKKWTKGAITRYYLSSEKGDSLGYVQELEKSLGNGAYDAHRSAKGEDCQYEVSHNIEDKDVLKAVSLANLDGELRPHTALLNKHSGTYGVVRGKTKAVWINASPINYAKD